MNFCKFMLGFGPQARIDRNPYITDVILPENNNF